MTNAGQLVLFFLLMPYALLGLGWGWALAEPGPLTDFSLVHATLVSLAVWTSFLPLGLWLRRRGKLVQLEDESHVRSLPVSLLLLFSWAPPAAMAAFFVLGAVLSGVPRLLR